MGIGRSMRYNAMDDDDDVAMGGDRREIRKVGSRACDEQMRPARSSSCASSGLLHRPHFLLLPHNLVVGRRRVLLALLHRSARPRKHSSSASSSTVTFRTVITSFLSSVPWWLSQTHFPGDHGGHRGRRARARDRGHCSRSATGGGRQEPAHVGVRSEHLLGCHTRARGQRSACAGSSTADEMDEDG
ncbi:hypothetical protein FA95DRAFT_912088 [Auriscalpium vulgare]|uniref:Uncharacterized protein n=1 Tax=Auriscalpium vulgare TaxID=40419 RepID=A0ACB8R7V7_9AGAM|nr:hypothetical protein FA95DRAFT_912088 [Auriscalpium vulgare]